MLCFYTNDLDCNHGFGLHIWNVDPEHVVSLQKVWLYELAVLGWTGNTNVHFS